MSELVGIRTEMLRCETRKAIDAFARWEERAIAAEKRASSTENNAEIDRIPMHEKIDRHLTLVEQLRNGEEPKAMTAHDEKEEKTVADFITKGGVLQNSTK